MATNMRRRASESSGHPFAIRVPFVLWRLPLIALVSTWISGCGTEKRVVEGTVVAIDDFGDTLRLAAAPRRIVSLNPASTELLFYLNAGHRLVGRTRWDVWPDSARFVPDVGDGIRPNIEAVLNARPDLVVLYASAENRNAARRLRQAGVQTLSLKVDLPAEFRELALLLGRALRDTVRAGILADSVDNSMQVVRAATANAPRRSVLWIADRDPLIVIGGGSFLNELIEIAGGVNVFNDIPDPSAPVSIESVLAREPEIILAAPGIASYVRSSPAWASAAAVRAQRVLDGDSWSMGRPSIRMGEAARRLARLIHPELFR